MLYYKAEVKTIFNLFERRLIMGQETVKTLKAAWATKAAEANMAARKAAKAIKEAKIAREAEKAAWEAIETSANNQ
jgi:hypothetical protein